MDLRENKQREFANIAHIKKKGILLLATRFGKIRTSIYLFQKFKKPKILIIYPDLKIKKSWEDEFEKTGYANENITFSTNMSLNKYENEKFDIIIIDECHLLSQRNMGSVGKLLKLNNYVIGLTGTLAENTKEELWKELKWGIIAEYSREEAIKDGIVADYKINIVTVALDNVKLNNYKGKKKTEKQKFDAYTWVIGRMKEEGKPFMFLALGRMRIIQNSWAKIQKTKELLKQFSHERVLVFCGLIKVAEQLGIAVQHSKSEEGVLEEFAEGEGNHLAVVKMGNSGKTYKPLNKVIINYFSSSSEQLEQQISRAMNLEFSGQICEIYILTTDETVEKRWLDKALSNYEPSKIHYL